VGCIEKCDPLKLDDAVAAIKRASEYDGVSAVIFKSPCIAIVKPEKACVVDNDKCRGCSICIRELGCPAISMKDGKAVIASSMCTGCELCSQVCPFDAIGGGCDD
ncbi:MAG: 4Fe-4S binding protein, partial [Clostridia bacterium]|nr:4Fe-4S binding protein [Clostridia bacterium]